LIQLEKALGMASRVYRGYELERNAYGIGNTITIRKPGTFTPQAGGTTTSQDIVAANVSITLDTWRKVQFELTDQEMAFTGQRIINEHIQPAAYALANELDTTLLALAKEVPWQVDQTGTAVPQDVLKARRIMRANGVPIDQGMIYCGISPTTEEEFLNSTIFHSASVTGGVTNQSTLIGGSLGVRFGTEFFPAPNALSFTGGTICNGGDKSGDISAAALKGATSVSIHALTDGETVVAGDIFAIAGQSQQYAVTTASATVAANTVTVSITPPLDVALSGGEVVTFITGTTGNQNLLFHQRAFALVVAPLPSNLPGIATAVATDRNSGLSLRSRMFTEGTAGKVYVALDILYGVKVLDGNLACRMRET
jgi:hypothetical protein